MKIDAHQHFWSIKRPNDYGFLTPDSGILYRDYLPDHLAPVLSRCGIDKTILVQAAPTREETKWLLDLAMNTSFVAGVVGWLEFDSDPDEFEMALNELRSHPKFVGVRPMLQELDDDEFVLRNRVLSNLKKLASAKVSLDLLVYPKHLPYIHKMLNDVPGIRAVIDHLAKPRIREQEMDTWKYWMEKISRFPNVWCKLSGMVTEAHHQHWKTEHIFPYVQFVLNSFGSSRVMYGSDWPVCLLAATYDRVVEVLHEMLADIDNIDKHGIEQILGANAAAFYRLTNA